MAAPEEIVAGPLTVWLAPVATAFPVIDAAPAIAWTKVGTEGDANYDEEGVTVSHGETVFDFTPAGRTMPAKRFRVGESFETSLNLVDLSPEMYALAMNNAALTTVAAGVGTAGQKFLDLYRGDIVNSFAVIMRGHSSVDNDLTMQYEFSNAFVSVNGDVQYTKGKVAMLPLKIEAIKHADADVIRVRIQTAVAS
jgi:hypothetical protein